MFIFPFKRAEQHRPLVGCSAPTNEPTHRKSSRVFLHHFYSETRNPSLHGLRRTCSLRLPTRERLPAIRWYPRLVRSSARRSIESSESPTLVRHSDRDSSLRSSPASWH